MRTSDGAVVMEGGSSSARGGASPVSYRLGGDGTVTVQVGATTGHRSLQRCTLDGECIVVAPGRARDTDIPEGEDPYFLADN